VLALLDPDLLAARAQDGARLEPLRVLARLFDYERAVQAVRLADTADLNEFLVANRRSRALGAAAGARRPP
jgi:hypothetical protein